MSDPLDRLAARVSTDPISSATRRPLTSGATTWAMPPWRPCWAVAYPR
jgi:hypothetical protein